MFRHSNAYFVQYTVDQTLRPVLEEAVAGKTADAAKIVAVLSVNCADLAMGSGHFPVAAMEYIARYLVDLGVTPTTDDRHPLGHRSAALVVDGQWSGAEPDLAYWKRRVAQNCIYVAAARDFGLNVDATLWKGLSDYLARGSFEVPQYATVLKEAAVQAAARKIPHVREVAPLAA